MNYGRVALAAIVAWIVDSVYGFLVFGLALQGEFARYPAVFRPFEDVSGMLPLMFGGSLLGFFALAYIFAKGHEGGSGLQEGLRFGIVLAIFELGAFSISSYVIYRYGRKLAVEEAIAGFVEAIIVGILFGLTYRPAASRSRRAAGV
jgi:hypothetical protein